MRPVKDLIYKPGQLYAFRKDIEVDCFAYKLTPGGFCSADEMEISLDCTALYLREYLTTNINEWSVFLFGDQVGVAMTKYFRRVKS